MCRSLFDPWQLSPVFRAFRPTNERSIAPSKGKVKVSVHGYTDQGGRQRRTVSKFTFRGMPRIVVQASSLLNQISVNG